MSLDRKKTHPQELVAQPHFSLDEPQVEFEPSKEFLCLSPENLCLNRSCQQLNWCNHQPHPGSRRYELITRTSTESRDTDSSSSSKKHGRKSKSPTRSSYIGRILLEIPIFIAAGLKVDEGDYLVFCPLVPSDFLERSPKHSEPSTIRTESEKKSSKQSEYSTLRSESDKKRRKRKDRIPSTILQLKSIQSYHSRYNRNPTTSIRRKTELQLDLLRKCKLRSPRYSVRNASTLRRQSQRYRSRKCQSPCSNKSRHSHKDNDSQKSSHHSSGESHKKKKRERRKRKRDVEEGGGYAADAEDGERSKVTCLVVFISTTIIVIAIMLVVLTLYFTPHFEDDERGYICCNSTDDYYRTMKNH